MHHLGCEQNVAASPKQYLVEQGSQWLALWVTVLIIEYSYEIQQ